ncbi:MAG: superoxide dismutase family protein, partial [Gemmatimonadota bacterium]
HPQGPHAGDLENLEVETDDGTARGTRRTDRVTLVPGQPNSILDADGSALVVHAQADDYVTQPSGDSGDPIACGVVDQT